MVSRFTLFTLLGLVAVGCSSRPKPVVAAPIISMPSQDPALADALNRCQAQLSALQVAQPSGPAPTSMVADRVVLAAKWSAARNDERLLDQRIARARRALQALATSDKERAIISETIIELGEGLSPKPALPKRVLGSEPYRDISEASALRAAKRADLERIGAQLDNVDRALSAPAQPVVPTP
jgi:hypothetical protein